ncbi:glycosyltransferase family 4 protein [Georgenia deserti]|uniref:Glycosyltransferase family 4 protein n=1 Tax=Georgenia deserti TaxID=2093781 RepID=A0ABW4L417_9MICO
MRVLQVTGSSAGGVGRHAREISRMLAEPDPDLGADTAGHTVLLAGPADVVAAVAPPVRTAVVEITDRPRPQDARVVAELRRLAAGADVVHAHGLRAGGLAAMAVATLADGPRLIVTLHNLPVGGRAVQTVAAGLERLVAGSADVVLGVSGDLVERMRERGAPRAVRALVPAPDRMPTGIDPGELRASLGMAPGERLLVTVARLAPQKGLDLLLDVAAVLRGPRTTRRTGRHAQAASGWRWVILGDGPLRGHVAARASAEDLPVHLAGHRDDAPDLMAAADVVVSTARWEGQPLWLQEALRAGAAVVATDVGGTAEVTGDAAVLVPPGDSDRLAEAVREVLADPERQTELRNAARARAATLPGPDDVRAQLEEIYGTSGDDVPRSAAGG